MRYSTAGSMNNEPQRASAIALSLARSDSPARRIQIDISQNAAIQSGTCTQRMAMIAAAPGERTNPAIGANKNHCNGV